MIPHLFSLTHTEMSRVFSHSFVSILILIQKAASFDPIKCLVTQQDNANASKSVTSPAFQLSEGCFAETYRNTMTKSCFLKFSICAVAISFKKRKKKKTACDFGAESKHLLRQCHLHGFFLSQTEIVANTRDCLTLTLPHSHPH